ncbi:MAG: hypothetical protein IJE43_02165 [Alphaproteobacteria bacterium]|nr:hypothetical protein [Alphaproteobacteria bacterium]
MRKVKIWLFKETGKFYAEESVEVPDTLTMPFEIVDYVEQKYNFQKTKYVVLPLQEEFIVNGYPCMIPIR